MPLMRIDMFRGRSKAEIKKIWIFPIRWRRKSYICCPETGTKS